MPDYIYRCQSCENTLAKSNKSPVTDETYESSVLFETSHRMLADKDELAAALLCPRCGSTDAARFYGNDTVICYIRGDGFLDRAGARRDMTLHTLENKDPYGHMRQPGEADDLKIKLKQAGKHNPKPRHFVMNDNKKH